MSEPQVYRRPSQDGLRSVLRRQEEYGLATVDLVGPPRRLVDNEGKEPLVEQGIDVRQVQPIPTPAEAIRNGAKAEHWIAASRRSLERLNALFLVCEDPQRRLDVREVETLAHQASLVRHILERLELKRVLIADEVGLGKTVEVGLILQELLAQTPGLRVLYLAPARLVSNVRREFDRLRLPFRQWSASDADARLDDNLIIASIHRAVLGDNFRRIVETKPWDVLIVDECHHLSAWSPDGGDPRQAYRLVKELAARQPAQGRLILMSGTPHQGHRERFKNLLNLLRAEGETERDLAGRVIYRTKDDIRDWHGRPVFPSRRIHAPVVLDLGPLHRAWLESIYQFYRPDTGGPQTSQQRAVGWRAAQALQWAASSPQAGLGYLVRQAIRAGWTPQNESLCAGLKALRPYRLGPADEPVSVIFERIRREVRAQDEQGDVEDIESGVPGHASDPESQAGLEALIQQGIEVGRLVGQEKFQKVYDDLLRSAGTEKVVLFAQPVETVTALSRFLEGRTGRPPALILGGQTDHEREQQVTLFQRADGPQFLVSSRAGGEGINLQVASRLVHFDVPWNPMEMEQRVGRVHRFGSRRTIVVDTLVVRDSREWNAYQAARARLVLIASSLVEPEKFESLYSRVMCLIPQDEFTDILLAEFGSPLSERSANAVAALVQEGFNRWKEFHQAYGGQKHAIEGLAVGESSWDDVVQFLQNHAGATLKADHVRQQFKHTAAGPEPAEEPATVISIPGQGAFVCSDHEDSLVFSPAGTPTPRMGLNRPPMKLLLRKLALADDATGGAVLKRPPELDSDRNLPLGAFGVLGFLQQTLQARPGGNWEETLTRLRLFVLDQNGSRELEGEPKGKLVRAILGAQPKRNLDSSVPIESLVRAEEETLHAIRKPSEKDFATQTRHAILPVFAAVVQD